MSPDQLMPQPAQLRVPGGTLPLSGSAGTVAFRGADSHRLRAAVERWQAHAARVAGGAHAAVEIVCREPSGAVPALGDPEAYHLTVGARGICIRSDGEWGILHGLSTLTQLVGAGGVPYVDIDDEPRLAWRGLMLDVARHFLPLAALTRTLDGMALVKLNVLHLHLTDDQGFRLPSDRYPELNGAGPCYSPDEVGQLVAYAAERAIRVVPELNMPGHCTAMLAARPDWGTRPVDPTSVFGVHPACLDVTRGPVMTAVFALIDEVAALFPDRFLHVGGDELDPTWWRDSAEVQANIRSLGLADERALQAHFTTRVAERCTAIGRRAIGWDEVLGGRVPAGTVVQCWRGGGILDKALNAGQDCVYSAGYYLDLMFPADVHYTVDPDAGSARLMAAEDELLSDPRLAHVADGIRWTHAWRRTEVPRGAAPGRLLGAEACLWSELVDADTLDQRLWGRLPAVAERFWSPATVADPADMYRRLPSVAACLERCAGIQTGLEPVLARFALDAEWRNLLEWLEPVKWYARLLGEEVLRARIAGDQMPRARPYGTSTPLDRVVDFLPVESAAARQLGAAVTRGSGRAELALRRAAAVWQSLDTLEVFPEGDLERCAAALIDLGRWIDAVVSTGYGTRRPGTDAPLVQAEQIFGEYLLPVAVHVRRWWGP